MRVFVTGAQGQLAMALGEAAGRHNITIITMGRPEFDLTQPASIDAALDSAKPDVVINTAAFTAVDKAETDAEAAFAINAVGAGELAGCCAARGIPIIHISTDYVFAGDSLNPYREDDDTGPAGVYGRSKLEGERLVARAGPRHVIVRTSWIYSPWGHNFLKTMLRVGASQRELKVVADQRGCPTYAPHLADACLTIAARIAGEPASSALWGQTHAAGAGETTWHGFACEIFRAAEMRGLEPMAVVPITTAEYPTPAQRPANSRLDCSRLRQTFGFQMPSWTAGTHDCVGRLLDGKSSQTGT